MNFIKSTVFPFIYPPDNPTPMFGRKWKALDLEPPNPKPYRMDLFLLALIARKLRLPSMKGFRTKSQTILKLSPNHFKYQNYCSFSHLREAPRDDWHIHHWIAANLNEQRAADAFVGLQCRTERRSCSNARYSNLLWCSWSKGCCKKQVAWFNGSHFRPTRMISSGSQIAGFGVKVCRHHPLRVIAFRLQRVCYGTNFPSSCCHSHVGMLCAATNVRATFHAHAVSNEVMLTIMRRGLAFWISVSLPYICLPFQKAGFFASHPPPPPEWAVQLFMWDGTVSWNLSRLFTGRGGS